MGVTRVLKGALTACIFITIIQLGIAANAASDEEIDDSHITVLTSENFDAIIKPVKHALVGDKYFYSCWLINSCFQRRFRLL
jgi:hypothetical protein